MESYTIWKYDVGAKEVEIEIPKGARLLSFQIQRGTPVLWFLVNPQNEKEIRKFHSFGTGHPIPAEIAAYLQYVGTVQHLGGTFIHHLFEEF